MQTRRTGAPSSGPHLYPELVDGRVEGDSGRRAVAASGRLARRSQSLVPESAAVVRQVGYDLVLRRRGFTALVGGGGATPHPPASLISRMMSSAHKHLIATRSDPTSMPSLQCASCGDRPELCLTALGIHDADAPNTSISSPRRVHSLLRRHRPLSSSRRSSATLSPRRKPRAITEEGSEQSSGLCTPDSDVCTSDSDLTSANCQGFTGDGGQDKCAQRRRKHLDSRAATVCEESGKGGAGLADYTTGVLEAVVSKMRRMSI